MTPTQMERRDLDNLQVLTANLSEITDLDRLSSLITDWLDRSCGLQDCVLYTRAANLLVRVAGPHNQPAMAMGQGLAGHAALRRESLYSPDTSRDQRCRTTAEPAPNGFTDGTEFHSGAASEYAAPLIHRGEVVGVLTGHNTRLNGIPERGRRCLDMVADILAPHVSALLTERLSERLDYGQVVAELAHMPTATQTELQAVYGSITERAAQMLNTSRAYIWMFQDHSQQMLECLDDYNPRDNVHVRGARLSTDNMPEYIQALNSERVILASDAAADPRTRVVHDRYLRTLDIKSVLHAPIRQDGRVVGVLCLVQQHTQRKWRVEEAAFVATLADLATIALTNHQKCLAENALVHAQKMESLGRLAGGIAHDFNNLLTVISGAVETLQLSHDRDAAEARMLKLIADAGTRAHSLTRNLMAFGGKQQLKLQPVSTAQLLANVQALTDGLLREDIRLTFQPCPRAPQLYTSGDVVQLEQVLLNLMINAADAMPDGGDLSVASFVCPTTGQLGISVTDTGSGISEQARPKIFDPFFTTKGDAGGGLGLSMSLGIIRQHGGTLVCTSTGSTGSRFDIRLPLAEPAAAAAADTDGGEHGPRAANNARILLVEDEQSVREVVEQMLNNLGYKPLVAPTSAAALRLLQTVQIDLLLSDVIMPDMRGPELYQAALAQQPRLRALFVSGYAEDVLLHAGARKQPHGFLSKPFSLQQLSGAIQQALADKPLHS